MIDWWLIDWALPAALTNSGHLKLIGFSVEIHWSHRVMKSWLGVQPRAQSWWKGGKVEIMSEELQCSAPAQTVPSCPFPSPGKMWELPSVCGLAAFASYKWQETWNSNHKINTSHKISTNHKMTNMKLQPQNKYQPQNDKYETTATK